MDTDYMEVFGVNEAEVADLPNEGAESMAETQNAESAENGANEAENAELPINDTENHADRENDTDAEEKRIQSKSENARYAAARRKAEAERDEAIRKAQEEARRSMEDMLSTIGAKNPYTGELIRTREEYEKYKETFQKAQKESMMERAGMNQEEWDAFIANLPEVREAREKKRDADAAIAKARINEEIAEITKLDKDINSVEDLCKMQTYPQFLELLKKGNSLLDSFRLANFEALNEKAAQRAAQRVRNGAEGKEHLKKTEARGTGAMPVPSDIKAEYRAFNPGISDAEIEREYQRYLRLTAK